MSHSADYQRGYAAGQRKEARTERDAVRQHEVTLARLALAAAIAPEIIRSPWRRKVDGVWKVQNTAAGIANTVADIAREIEARL